MKKFSWKKLLSLVLVAALVIGTFRVSGGKVSADEEAPKEEITLSKTAGEFDYGSKSVSVELNVKAGSREEKIDAQLGYYNTEVVIILDASNSINTYAGSIKTAAKSFVDSIAKAYDETKGIVTKAAVVQFTSSAKTLIGMTNLDTNGKNSVKLAIDNYKNTSGSNIPNALDEARGLFTNDKNANKIIVLLTDGYPNYYSASGYYSDRYKQALLDSESKLSDLKAAGMTVFTLHYNITTNDNYGDVKARTGKVFSQNAASGSDKCVTTASLNESDLVKSFVEVAEQINKLPVGNNAVVTEKLPDGFVVDESSIDSTLISNGTIVISDDKKTITWNIGDLKDTNATLSYKAKLVDDAGTFAGKYEPNVEHKSNVEFAYNSKAVLEYQDNGANQKKEFNNPKTTIETYTVTFKVVDAFHKDANNANTEHVLKQVKVYKGDSVADTVVPSTDSVNVLIPQPDSDDTYDYTYGVEEAWTGSYTNVTVDCVVVKNITRTQTEKPVYYTVTYEVQNENGEYDVKDSESVKAGEAATKMDNVDVPDAPKHYSYSDGWYYLENNEKKEFDGQDINNNIIVYKDLCKNPEYTVIVNYIDADTQNQNKIVDSSTYSNLYAEDHPNGYKVNKKDLTGYELAENQADS